MCEAKRDPARAISYATSTILSASTPHSSAAYSGVYSEYSSLITSINLSNEHGSEGRSVRINSSQLNQRRMNWRLKAFSRRITEAIASNNAASVPGHGDNQ